MTLKSTKEKKIICQRTLKSTRYTGGGLLILPVIVSVLFGSLTKFNSIQLRKESKIFPLFSIQMLGVYQLIQLFRIVSFNLIQVCSGCCDCIMVTVLEFVD